MTPLGTRGQQTLHIYQSSSTAVAEQQKKETATAAEATIKDSNNYGAHIIKLSHTANTQMQFSEAENNNVFIGQDIPIEMKFHSWANHKALKSIRILNTTNI